MQERPVSAGTGSGSGGRTPAQAAGPDLAAVGVSRVCDHRQMAHRYRLYPGATQMAVLEKHCRDARAVWNTALEQANWWRPWRGKFAGVG